MAGERTGGQKKALADGPAADALPLELVADQGNIQGIGQGLAAEAQLYGDMAAVIFPEGDNGPAVIPRADGLIDGTLAGKEIEHSLLYNIPLIMPVQNQFHKIVSSLPHGFPEEGVVLPLPLQRGGPVMAGADVEVPFQLAQAV